MAVLGFGVKQTFSIYDCCRILSLSGTYIVHADRILFLLCIGASENDEGYHNP